MTCSGTPYTDTLPVVARQTAPPVASRASSGFPTGTVTLLFTDIEGSTRLLRHLGSADYAYVLGMQRRLLRAAFQRGGGREVDTAGDGCFAVFQHAALAAEAAVAAQRALAAFAWPKGGQVRVRMGLHTGTPGLFAEGYVGLDVHRAARICSAAQGGQILLSQATREVVERTLPSGMYLLDVGPSLLKDLDHPEHLSALHGVNPPCESYARLMHLVA